MLNIAAGFPPQCDFKARSAFEMFRNLEFIKLLTFSHFGETTGGLMNS